MAALRSGCQLVCGLLVLFVAGCGDQPARVLVPRPASEPASLTPKVSLTAHDAPRICFFNEFFDYCYPAGGYFPGAKAEVPLEVGDDRVVTMNWNAEPDPGTSMRWYRWSLDPYDLSDETPRTDENTDLAHWSQRSLDATSARLGPWSSGEVHRLYIEAEDDMGLRSLGIVRFEVVHVANRPPECSEAMADPPVIWSPDHRLVPVSITSVSDPDGDPVVITVTRVTQDEPLVGGDSGGDQVAMGGEIGGNGATVAENLVPAGDGNHCPDAVIDPLSGGVAVRAERSARGNGRVYTIWFTASDQRGGSCDGSVRVCVPHHRNARGCIDDGQRFNSVGDCPGVGPDGVLPAQR